MKNLKRFLVLCIFLAALISGCALAHTNRNVTAFPFTPPDGYQLSDVSETKCSIIDKTEQEIGGIIRTELPRWRLREIDVITYYDTILPEHQMSGWREGNFLHPIWYNSISVVNPETNENENYYSMIIARGKFVYDMWFVLSKIDSTQLSAFKSIAEK